ncbi:MAG: neutral zinc metallopeptidase [Caulobacteraceae bacterium]
MKLDDMRETDNVDDRRGQGGGGFGGIGGGRIGGRGMAVGGGGLGLVAVVVIVLLLGGDPTSLLTGMDGSSSGQGGYSSEQSEGGAPTGPRGDDEAFSFSRKIIASTEDVWTEIFRENGMTYEPATFTPYDGQTQTAGCGGGQAAMGPFYCPADRRVYIDLSFFRELDQRFGAPGDFAQAYVLAHEIGHNIQMLLGLSDMVERASRRSEREGNRMSVKLELQADCFAGVWANRANRERHILEPGDVEEGLAAANAVGDDTLQRQAGGAVVPDSFTHGSSEERMRWFKRGFDSGDPEACDTFGTGVFNRRR